MEKLFEFVLTWPAKDKANLWKVFELQLNSEKLNLLSYL